MPRATLLTLTLLLLAQAASAQEMPEGWFLTGGNRDAYTATPDATAFVDGGRSAVLRTVADPDGSYGALAQACRADAWKGRRVKLTGRVKTQDVSGWAGLWLRGDDRAGTIVAYDNMKDRPIKGTTDWQPYTIILDIPATATALVYAAHLHGTGALWVDDLKLEPVGNDVEVTWAVTVEMSKRPLPESVIVRNPDNLSFERWAARQPEIEDGSGPIVTPVH